MSKKFHYLILVILVLLPACFPFASRYGYNTIIDFEGSAVLWIIGFFIVMAPYWCLVGHLFARWVGSLGKSFFLGNMPIFFNAAGEIIYYVILAKTPEEMPFLACLIGSHIDKISLFGLNSFLVEILFYAALLLLLFTCGYGLKKRRLRDPLPSREE